MPPTLGGRDPGRKALDSQAMSLDGHIVSVVPPGAGAVVLGEFDLAPNTWFPWYSHDHHHQLAWAAGGVVLVNVGDAHWVLPPSRALWLPAETTHRTGASGKAQLRGVYVDPVRCPLTWRRPEMVAVSPLLRELLTYLAAPRRRRGALSRRGRAVRPAAASRRDTDRRTAAGRSTRPPGRRHAARRPSRPAQPRRVRRVDGRERTPPGEDLPRGNRADVRALAHPGPVARRTTAARRCAAASRDRPTGRVLVTKRFRGRIPTGRRRTTRRVLRKLTRPTDPRELTRPTDPRWVGTTRTVGSAGVAPAKL